MSRKVRFITIGAIVLLIAGMALYPVVKKWLASDEIPSAPPTERQQRNALHVNAEILEHQSLDEVFQATGLLIPDEEVDLAFETSGKITNIYFQEGTHVKRATCWPRSTTSLYRRS